MVRAPRTFGLTCLLGLLLAIAGCTTVPGRAPPADPAAVTEAKPEEPASTGASRDEPGVEIAGSAAAAQSPAPSVPAPQPNNAAALLSRLSQQLDEPHCDDPATQRTLRALSRQPRALSAKLERVAPMLDYILARVEQHGLPGQFALIPWAESGFRADPGNRGTVQGLWQFTVSTGRAHGLTIDRHFDGRRAAIESTIAAMDHLQRLQARFGDWRLSILAYNAGEYRVARGIRNDGLPPGALPKNLEPHSYAYLHKISALACMFRNPKGFGLDLSEAPLDRLQAIQRPEGVYSTSRLAKALGVELDELLRYNAAFRDGDIAEHAPAQILLPGSVAHSINSTAVAAAVAQHEPSAQSATTSRRPRQHVVSAGENLWRIARRYGVRLKDLLGWNRLSASSTIRPGQRLQLAPD